MLTVKIAAEAAGVRVETIYNWLKVGILTGKRPGPRGRWRINRESLLLINVPEADIAKAERKFKR
jgi:excisionase family DNA binding protein